MRRMDADGDEELSFSDFFTSLLPYFIYGDLHGEVNVRMVASKFSKKGGNHISALHGNRAKSAAATGQRHAPSNNFSKDIFVDTVEDYDQDFCGENIQGLRNSTDLGLILKGLNFAKTLKDQSLKKSGSKLFS